MTTHSLWPSFWKRDPDGPKDALVSLRDEIDRAFEHFGRSLPEIAWPGEGFTPRLDVTQTDSVLEVTAELPGVKPEAVEITIEGDLLSIRGEKSAESDREEGVRRVRERSWGAFSRAVRLPFEPDPDAMSARFAEGVLTVTMPAPAGAAPKPRKIAVQAS